MPVKIEVTSGKPEFYYHKADGNKPISIAAGRSDSVTVRNFLDVHRLSLDVKDTTYTIEERARRVGAVISYTSGEWNDIKVYGDIASLGTRTFERTLSTRNTVEVKKGGKVKVTNGHEAVEIVHGFDLPEWDNDRFLADRAEARKKGISLREYNNKRYSI